MSFIISDKCVQVNPDARVILTVVKRLFLFFLYSAAFVSWVVFVKRLQWDARALRLIRVRKVSAASRGPRNSGARGTHTLTRTSVQRHVRSGKWINPTKADKGQNPRGEIFRPGHTPQPPPTDTDSTCLLPSVAMAVALAEPRVRALVGRGVL